MQLVSVKLWKYWHCHWWVCKKENVTALLECEASEKKHLSDSKPDVTGAAEAMKVLRDIQTAN